MEVRNLLEIILYFILYSFLGWLMESVLKSISQRKIVNSGFLVGPFCPIYGLGALIMYFSFRSIKENWIFVFVLSILLLSLLEYFVGFLLETIFHRRYWDYSKHKWNLKGRICFINSLAWGVLGVIFITFLHPYIQGKVATLSDSMIWYITILLSTYFLVDMIGSMISISKMDKRSKTIQKLDQRVKIKLSELEDLKSELNSKQIDGNTLQKDINALKLKQSQMEKKVNRQTNRLKRAFPTMKWNER